MSRPTLRALALGAVAAGALAAAAPAAAHVSLDPAEARIGAPTALDVRVPNERDDAATVGVDVRLPAGVELVEAGAVPGWDVRTEPDAAGATRITWTADDAGGITGGESVAFPLQVRVRSAVGGGATIPAVQTYDDGEVVRWIGQGAGAKPAPVLAVSGPAATVVSPAIAPESDDESSDSVPIAAGAVVVIIIVGATALVIRRRRPTKA